MFVKNKTNLEAALIYAQAGMAVLPLHSVINTDKGLICTCGKLNCAHPGKHPATYRGLKDATPNIEQIKLWWQQNKAYNIGIVPGLSGLVVMDVDPKNNGDHSLDMLINRYGTMGFDKVPRVITGSGGNHYWFKAEHNHPLSNARGDLPEGIDVRGVNGYVVVPPSLHGSGKTYCWENINSLQDLTYKLEPLHPSILSIIKTKKKTAVFINDGNSTLASNTTIIREGNRNNTLTSLAGTYFNKNLSHTQVLTLLRKDNADRCETPLPDNEVTQIVDSVQKYHLQENMTWREPLPIKKSELLPVLNFDLDKMLPDVLRDFVKDCAYRTQTPPDLIASPLVAMFSALLGANYRMHPKQKDNWAEVPNLWSMIIAPPGSLKTNCLGEALKPIKFLAANAHEKFVGEQEAYQKELSLYKIKREAMEKALKDAYKSLVKGGASKKTEGETIIKTYEQQLTQLSPPKEPFEKRYITSDATIEILQEILKNNSGGLLMERDELISLLMTFEKTGHEADRGFYLAGWNGHGDYQVDRLGRGSTYVSHLCLAVIGGTQPEKIQAYIAKNTSPFANDGLIQRFQLMVYPDFKERAYIDEYPNNQAKQAVYKIVNTIASPDFLRYSKGKQSEFDKNELLHFSFENLAQAKFKEWLIALEQKIEQEENSIIKEHLSKYRGLIPSLALIFHVITMAQTGQNKNIPVTIHMLNMAISWHPYLESHARRIYDMNITERALPLIAKKILKGEIKNGFSSRDIYRKNFAGLGRNAELIKELCEELEEMNWLRAVHTPAGKHQKTAMVYNINPRLATLATDEQGASEKTEMLIGNEKIDLEIAYEDEHI